MSLRSSFWRLFNAPIAPAHWRGGLALLRLCALFILGCALVLAAALQLRQQSFIPRQTVPTGSHSGPRLGVNVELEQYTPVQMETTLHSLHDAGFHWVRQRIDWGRIEPQPGHYRWEQTDAMLHALRQSRLTPIIVLDGSPVWAVSPQDRQGPHSALAPPQDPHTFAAFAAAFARRYAPHVHHYQLWDEPNIAPHWGQNHIDPVGYAQLVRAAAPAIRAEDADAVILAAALAPTIDRGHLALDEVYFLQRFIAAGGADAVDAFAIQPYGFAEQPIPHMPAPDRLSFARALYVRAALEDAGQGHKPIWAMRFGWNRQANAQWGAVSPGTQAAFAQEAVAIAQDWPWLAGLGWAIEQPDAPAEDPRWGFALTPPLTAALINIPAPAEPKPARVQALAAPAAPYVPPYTPSYTLQYISQQIMPRQAAQPVWVTWTLLAMAGLVILQRGYAAGNCFPWKHWRQRWQAAPSSRHITAWLLLGILYYLATWPPLIALCWLLIAVGVWLIPRHGLYLAALLLPFYFQHKEVQIVDIHLAVPPAQVVVFALIPPLLLAVRDHPSPRSSAQSLLLTGWLLLSLPAWLNTWHHPALLQGFAQWMLVPFLLFWATSVLLIQVDTRRTLTLFLAGGGLLAGFIGLGLWLAGQGVWADGTLRLTGPYFSPNHLALYAGRTLFVVAGLALTTTHKPLRWGGFVMALTLLALLLLTGSRGALLLGLPAGLLYGGFALYRRLEYRPAWFRKPRGLLDETRLSGTQLRGLLLVAGIGIALPALFVLGGLGPARLFNLASVIERLEIWQAALHLWYSLPWSGVGPEAFFWTFPAYVPINTSIDPNIRHPHNVWLEILTTWGILGALWFIGLTILLIRHLATTRQARQNDRLHVGLAAAFVAALAHAQVDAFMALPDLAAWNALALALLIHRTKKQAASFRDDL